MLFPLLNAYGDEAIFPFGVQVINKQIAAAQGTLFFTSPSFMRLAMTYDAAQVAFFFTSPFFVRLAMTYDAAHGDYSSLHLFSFASQ